MMITQVYALTTEAQAEKADEFYGPIQSEMWGRTHKPDVLPLVKDWKAKVGNIMEKIPVRLIT